MQKMRWFMAGMLFALLIVYVTGKRGGDTSPPHEEHGGHESHEKESTTIRVSKDAQNLLELKTATVRETASEQRLSVVGEIAQDPEEVRHILSPQEGAMASIRIQSGAGVKKGDVLAALTPKDGSGPVEIISPINGIVLAQHAREGDRVEAITSLYTLADLSKLPATFNVYEKDIGRVKQGQRMLVRSIAYPEKEFEGMVTFISPRVEEDSHMIRIRAVVENPEYLLKLGMFVTGEIICREHKQSAMVPRSALYLLDGKQYVFVKTGDVEFEARPITVGRESDAIVSVVSGLKRDETVVCLNAFLLKSELLKAKMGAGCAE